MSIPKVFYPIYSTREIHLLSQGLDKLLPSGEGKEKGSYYRARNIYLLGIALWFAIWLVLIYAIMDQYLRLNMFAVRSYWWLFFFVSILGCAIGLSVNAKIWWAGRKFEDYNVEVNVIEFVERNVSPLITANSIVLSVTFLACITVTKKFPPTAFVVYEMLSMIFACLVLPLYWIPSDSVRDLVRLRHVKTVFFFYSVFFLFAALMVLALLTTG